MSLTFEYMSIKKIPSVPIYISYCRSQGRRSTTRTSPSLRNKIINWELNLIEKNAELNSWVRIVLEIERRTVQDGTHSLWSPASVTNGDHCPEMNSSRNSLLRYAPLTSTILYFRNQMSNFNELKLVLHQSMPLCR